MTENNSKLTAFARYAWLVLAWNIIVILWGVFLRASKSGDGCGQHWLTCKGEVIPSAPELKTVIEFSHRLMSALAFILVLALVIWAFRKFEKGSPVRKTAIVSLVFIITEALVGAGLVLTGNTAETLTSARPFWMAGHLINTFILLTFLCLTAWHASGKRRLNFQVEPKILFALGLAVLGIFLVGISGSIAALSSMIFASDTLAESLAKDFSPTSNMLLRLRLFHPILSILTAVYLIFVAGWMKKTSENDGSVARWSNILSILVLAQIAFGAATLLTLAPIVMQLGHLFLADAVWISFVLMAASFLAMKSEIR